MPAPSKSRKRGRSSRRYGHAGRHQDAARPQPRAVGQRHDPHAFVDPEAGHFARHGDARAEALRLQQRVARQFGAGDAGREPEIVLDPRAGAGLPAGRQRVRARRRPALRRRRRPRRRAPEGPAPTTTRSCTSAGSSIDVEAGAAARALRWTAVVEIGLRARSRRACPRRECRTGEGAARPAGRSPTSIHVNGIALRVAKSRSRCASAEKREPMIFSAFEAVAQQERPPHAGRP